MDTAAIDYGLLAKSGIIQQPIFIFDSDGIPMNRNIAAGKYIGYSEPRSLENLLDHLDIKHPESLSSLLSSKHSIALYPNQPNSESTWTWRLIAVEGTVPQWILYGSVDDILKKKSELQVKHAENLKQLQSLCEKVTANSSYKNSSIIDCADAIHRYYDNLIAHMPGNVYWWNRDNVCLGVNDNVAKLLGLRSRSDAVGKTYEDFAKIGEWQEEQADIFKQEDNIVMNSGIPRLNIDENIPLHMPDGREVYYLTSRVPIFSDSGEVTGIIGISVDVTERKKVEQQLRKAKGTAEQANQLKMDFIRNMEHDIRTPFTGIWGITCMLADEEPPGEKKTVLQEVSESAKVLLDYCNNILEFSRIESKSIPIIQKPFHLDVLLENIMKTERVPARLKKLDLLTSYDPNIPNALIGDSYRLNSVIINLLSNAIKFTDTGHVKLSTKLVRPENSHRQVVVQFIIEDTGIGIPEDKKVIIYDKFTRLHPSNQEHYKGQGLGLRVVKCFVDDLEGDIDLESISGTGSIFTITVPLKVSLNEET